MNTEIIIAVLLAIIAGSELLRLFLTHRPLSKKQHFKDKLKGTMRMIYDLEFKAFKTREIREEIRHEYDMMMSRIRTIDEQIANFPQNGDQGEKARLDDQKVLAQRDADRFLAQIKALDAEVDGKKPDQEDHEGVVGITSQIESMRELCDMLRDWIKKI